MKKLNNKGFSLVELIIVIAIMAILVGVVGTQVIPYLENSRQAKDYQILSSWNTAAMSAYSSAAAKIDSNKSYVIDISLKDSAVSVVNYRSATGSVTTAAPFVHAAATTSTAPTDADLQSISKFFEELTNIKDFKQSSFASKLGKGKQTGKTFDYVLITIDKDGTILLTCNAGTFDQIESK